MTAETGLRRDAVGLREVLFQSITDMAPGAAIAASIPAGVAFAGGALPLAVVFALIACLFSAWNIGQLAACCRRLARWPPIGIHNRRHTARRDIGLSGQPVVAMGGTRSAHHFRGRLFRHQDLGQAGHDPWCSRSPCF
jgi:hypothetical protein